MKPEFGRQQKDGLSNFKEEAFSFLYQQRGGYQPPLSSRRRLSIEVVTSYQRGGCRPHVTAQVRPLASSVIKDKVVDLLQHQGGGQ
ncbi:hypothetical protein Q3G72_014912 [Acer saccharum]|nr:hypothetical protein Q3G72_014912 [Acer saccharum]